MRERGRGRGREAIVNLNNIGGIKYTNLYVNEVRIDVKEFEKGV